MPMGGEMPLVVGGNKKTKGGLAKGTAGKGYGKGKKGKGYRDKMMDAATKGAGKMQYG